MRLQDKMPNWERVAAPAMPRRHWNIAKSAFLSSGSGCCVQSLIVSKMGACMAMSRKTLLLLLLPCPAVVYLAASLEDVNASSQCLSSAEAVRLEYPGAWPSWTMQSPNHKGVRCWFPAMRENHARHAEAPPHKNTAEQRRHNEPSANNKLTDDTPLASANEMNELGWSFRSRTTNVGPGTMYDAYTMVESSFDDRFAAAFEVSSVRQPSVIQRMMDPVGAIP